MYVNIVSTMRHGHESITPPSSGRNFGDLASELAAEQFIPSSSKSNGFSRYRKGVSWAVSACYIQWTR